MIFKIGVLENVTKLTGTKLLESLFNKAAGLKSCYSIEKRFHGDSDTVVFLSNLQNL